MRTLAQRTRDSFRFILPLTVGSAGLHFTRTSSESANLGRFLSVTIRLPCSLCVLSWGFFLMRPCRYRIARNSCFSFEEPAEGFERGVGCSIPIGYAFFAAILLFSFFVEPAINFATPSIYQVARKLLEHLLVFIRVVKHL